MIEFHARPCGCAPAAYTYANGELVNPPVITVKLCKGHELLSPLAAKFEELRQADPKGTAVELLQSAFKALLGGG